MKDTIEHFWRSFKDSAWLLLIATLIFYAMEDSDVFVSLDINAYMPVLFYVWFMTIGVLVIALIDTIHVKDWIISKIKRGG